MNLSNIWKHPKTTVVGLLLGAVQIGSVLMNSGIGGASPWLGAGVGIATVLLGALAKDPGSTAGVTVTASNAKLSAWALIMLLLFPGTFLQVGCTQSQVQETEALVNVAIQAAGNLAAVADPGAAWAAAMPAALQGLQSAEANFEAGTGVEADVSNAMLAVEDVIAQVEPNSKASELADILTTAIDAALVLLPAPTSTPAPAATNTATLAAPHLTLAAYQLRSISATRYNHHNRVSIHHRIFRSRADDFKAAWNKAAVKAGLSKAVIK
jgi:hypothetical protein